jgi:type II secretory ATPase GspE/PulE/Tfp pilus assembly ATPase PilB-like protein
MVPEYSVASYVAVHKTAVNIKDAYDSKELENFEPPVTFLKEIDSKLGYRTRQMLVAPILDPQTSDLLGVVQIINTLSGSAFSKLFEEAAIALCNTLAIAFRQRLVRRPKVRGKLDYLIVEGVLGTTQFDHATDMARSRGVSLEDYLQSDFKVKDDALGRALAKYYHLAYEAFRPDRKKPEALLRKIKRDVAEKNGWIPIDDVDGVPIVLTTDPDTATQARAVLDRHRIEYRVCGTREFRATLDQMFGTVSGLQQIVTAANQAAEQTNLEEETHSEESAANDSEVTKVVNKMIVDAHSVKATDIHIEPRPGRSGVIRFRRDGSLVKYDELPARLRSSVVSRLKIMANLNIAQKLLPQDGKIKFKNFHPLDIELRMATIPTAGGVEDVVLRILASGKPLSLEELNLSKKNVATLKSVVSKPYGLFFVCGPTGSGKTTTLHSVLSFLNTEDTKIWTAEDPVEITQEGLRQVQINKQQKLTFDVCMRAFLRADPDVIMVGEMRDKETVSTGIEASLTGHLVLATLHTNSAPESIIRLLDMGMDPFNFADALLGVLAQRLAKRLCPDCRKARPATQEETKALLLEYCEELQATEAFKNDANSAMKRIYEGWRELYSSKDRLMLYDRVGCERCAGTGYRGRVGLHELLVGTDALKKDIQDHARVSKMLVTAMNDGMRTLKQDGIEKALQGLTDMEQVKKVCIK